MNRNLILTLLAFLSVALIGAVSLGKKCPIKWEFYDSKDGVDLLLSLEEGAEFPYDEVQIRITRILGADGRKLGKYLMLSRAELKAGKVWMNGPWGSECLPGDRYVIQIPKFDPLEIDCPDSAKGLKRVPWETSKDKSPAGK